MERAGGITTLCKMGEDIRFMEKVKPIMNGNFPTTAVTEQVNQEFCH
jgi:hypothetical protein